MGKRITAKDRKRWGTVKPCLREANVWLLFAYQALQIPAYARAAPESFRIAKRLLHEIATALCGRPLAWMETEDA